MSVQRISRRYASALLNAAAATGNVETIEKDVNDVQRLLNESSDLRILFRSPVIEPSRKKAIIKEIFAKSSISPTMLDFIEFLVQKGRAGYFREIADAMHIQLDKQRGILRAEITSAVALDESTSAKLVDALGKKLGAKVIATYSVDPSVLGGVAISIEDRVIDSTLRRQLADLQSEMVA